MRIVIDQVGEEPEEDDPEEEIADLPPQAPLALELGLEQVSDSTD